MNKEQAIRESIRLYEEIKIPFAESRPKDCFPNRYLMILSTGHDWSYLACPLCMKYATKTMKLCKKCPLGKKYGMCGDLDTQNAWNEMNISTTWKTWIQYAKELVKQLKRLLKGDRK